MTALPAGDGFRHLLHAEWTKFRTVRGWVIGVLVAIGTTVLIGLAGPAGSTVSCAGPNGQPCAHRGPLVGPEGLPVTDSFYFVHRSLRGDGSITARVTGLTGRYPTNGTAPAGQGPSAGMSSGVQPWSKAGIIVKDGTTQGSAYAAVMVTGGNGVRMQYDYTHDTAGLPGDVSATAPRWLRLTRAGDTLTGADSTDGTRWHVIGTAHLAGLPSTAQVGLFATSPEYEVISQSFGGSTGRGGPSQATGVLDDVTLTGAHPGGWTGTDLSEGGLAGPSAGFTQAGGTFTVSGSGDIAPIVPGGRTRTVADSLVGGFAGLIALVVVASMFMTGEYRRGLIRTTMLASPRRGRVLAAKAVVIGAISFGTGLVACAVTIPLVQGLERAKGFYVYPTTPSTELRVVVGTAALLAVAAVLALAVGTVVRHGAAAVATAIVGIVLPYILAIASVLPAGAAEWLLRLTPAAAFAVQQAIRPYPQVTAGYTPDAGYFPLVPLAGFAVLCGYAVVALGLAGYLLRRRDV